MGKRVERHPKARLDAFEAALHIGENSADAALRFLDALEETLNLLAGMPELGRIRTFDAATLTGLRSIQVKGFDNYLVFYRPIESGVEVVRILHGARDLPSSLTGHS